MSGRWSAEAVAGVARDTGWSEADVDLLRFGMSQGERDANPSPEELALFLRVAKSHGLNPLTKEIYATRRKGKLTFQVGIDGYRIMAERTGGYAGNDGPRYVEADGHPASASVTVWRIVQGQRVGFTATARWEEYHQTGKDGRPSEMWARMPYLMLGKCAEALALRVAFPQALGGLYTTEEMQQADGAQTFVRSSPMSPAGEKQPEFLAEEFDREFAEEFDREFMDRALKQPDLGAAYRTAEEPDAPKVVAYDVRVCPRCAHSHDHSIGPGTRDACDRCGWPLKIVRAEPAPAPVAPPDPPGPERHALAERLRAEIAEAAKHLTEGPEKADVRRTYKTAGDDVNALQSLLEAVIALGNVAPAKLPPPEERFRCKGCGADLSDERLAAIRENGWPIECDTCAWGDKPSPRPSVPPAPAPEPPAPEPPARPMAGSVSEAKASVTPATARAAMAGLKPPRRS